MTVTLSRQFLDDQAKQIDGYRNTYVNGELRRILDDLTIRRPGDAALNPHLRIRSLVESSLHLAYIEGVGVGRHDEEEAEAERQCKRTMHGNFHGAIEEQEVRTIVAALRWWQRLKHRPDDLLAIASEDGKKTSLDSDEIDCLINKLNGEE